MARASLQSHQLDRADDLRKTDRKPQPATARQTPLDAEPHLPIALGAALEVQAQVLAAKGEPAQAVALLRRSLVTYRNTSIQTRLQKNLNVLGLTGQPAPPLNISQFLGPSQWLLPSSQVPRCCSSFGRTGAATVRRKAR